MAKRKRTNPRRRPATKADLLKIKREATKEVLTMLMCVPLMACHDIWGFGPKRLEQLADRMLSLYQDWESGDFSVEEAHEWMADYVGMRIEEAHE